MHRWSLITDQLKVTSQWCVAWVSRPFCITSRHVTDWDQFQSHTEEEEKMLEKTKNKGWLILKTDNEFRNRQTNNVQARRVISKKKQKKETMCSHFEDGTNPCKSKFKEKMYRSKPGRALPRGSWVQTGRSSLFLSSGLIIDQHGHTGWFL